MTKLIASLLIGLAGATGTATLDRGPRPVPRLLCERPPEQRLIRFEDGSARLECGRRLLVGVAVPW